VVATTKPTPTSGNASTKPTAAGPSWTWAASVEEVSDEEDLGRSVILHNLRYILEATDGSNNDPVISVNEKRLCPRPQGKKAEMTKPKPIIPAGPSWARAASVEEILDNEDISSFNTVLHNPRNILEASDGSDNNPPPSESAMDVDDRDDIIETPEEDDEAELGLFSVTKLVRKH